MKQKLYSIVATLMMSSGLILILYCYLLLKPKISNGFNRSWSEVNLSLRWRLSLKSNAYYFAGASGDRIYLGLSSHPVHLVQLDDTLQHAIQIKTSSLPFMAASKIQVDSGYFLLADLSRYRVYRGETTHWTMDSHPIQEKEFFTEFSALNSHSIVLRGYDATHTEYEIFKVTPHANAVRKDGDLLHKQIDGIFCTDGMLNVDRPSKRVVYNYFYRNEFIVADSNLDVTYRSHTIDTVSRARINVSLPDVDGTKTLASPPMIVNRRSVVLDGMLYVNSNLMADNEQSISFRHADVIDMYQLKDGRYLSSFYLPHVNHERSRHFFIKGNRLYSLHGTVLVMYELEKRDHSSFTFHSSRITTTFMGRYALTSSRP